MKHRSWNFLNSSLEIIGNFFHIIMPLTHLAAKHQWSKTLASR